MEEEKVSTYTPHPGWGFGVRSPPPTQNSQNFSPKSKKHPNNSENCQNSNALAPSETKTPQSIELSGKSW